MPGKTPFGDHVRELREKLRETDRTYSVRQVAGRIGVEPSYLSKVERGHVAPPSEETVVRLAEVLGEDPDVLLALAGKVSGDLQDAIRRRRGFPQRCPAGPRSGRRWPRWPRRRGTAAPSPARYPTTRRSPPLFSRSDQ